MNKSRLVLTVYSRTYKAANDDASSSAVHSKPKELNDAERRTGSGWDPFEVWRTRIRLSLKRDPLER